MVDSILPLQARRNNWSALRFRSELEYRLPCHLSGACSLTN